MSSPPSHKLMHFPAPGKAFPQHTALTTYTTMGIPSKLSPLGKISVHSGCQWRYLEPAGEIFLSLDTLRQSYNQFRPLRVSWTCAKWVSKACGSQQGMKAPVAAMIGESKPQTLNFWCYLQPAKPNKVTKSNREEEVLGLLPSALWAVCRSCSCSCAALFSSSVPSRPHHSHLW